MLPAEITITKTNKAPPVAAELRLKARQCIAHFIERANREQRVPIKMPTCSFDLRGTTAGMAHLRQNHVQLNAVLLTENFDHFLKDTIPHEVAHLVTWVKYGDRASAHGKEWQGVMRAFGLEPTRCHSLDTSNSRVAKVLYRYRCACRTFELTPRTHGSARAGNRFCKKCKHTIQYTGEIKRQGDDWRQVEPAPTTPPRLYVRKEPRSVDALYVKVPGGNLRVSLPRGLVPPAPRLGTPRPATPVPADGPTAAMLRYMEDLARSLRWTIPPEALASRRAASEFIDRAKAAKASATQTTPTPPTRTPPGPGTPTTPTVEPPTEKQLSYAKSIAARKRLTIPPEVLASKRAISAWIDANR